MCHFITLVTDCADTSALSAAMDRHGRAARAQTSVSIQKYLRNEERQYLTSVGSCDCGTALVRSTGSGKADEREKLIQSKTRKGWSKAKTERWIAERTKADARPKPNSDSHEMWARILSEVLALPGTTSAGLVVHFYGGGIDEEAFSVSRREAEQGKDLIDLLHGLKEDELLVVRRNRRAPG